jgi:endonuclease/exonuclease/phosphatase family metal-dependent hydrolase
MFVIWENSDKMKIVSINTNKRLGAKEAKRRFEDWLLLMQPDLVCCQEPVRGGTEAGVPLAHYTLLGATPVLNCWSANGQNNGYQVVSDIWQTIILPELTVHNVYLSPYSSVERTKFLLELAEVVKRSFAPVLIMGDFNMAALPEDGLYDGLPSAWSKPAERRAYAELLETGQLVDYAAGCGEFTLDRLIRRKRSQFRCDLVLGNVHRTRQVSVSYYHSVRTGESSFTDHSAIKISF